MTGNEIRKQYNQTKDLKKAITNTLFLLESSDKQTLEVMSKWLGEEIEFYCGIGFSQLVALVSKICNTETIRTEKLIWKMSYNNEIYITLLSNEIGGKWQKSVASSYGVTEPLLNIK